MTLQQIIDFLEDLIQFLEKLLSIWPVKLFAGKKIISKHSEVSTKLIQAKQHQKDASK